MALLTIKVNGNVVFSTDNSSGSTTVDITNYVQFGNNTIEIDVGSGACPASWLFGCVSKPGNIGCTYPSGVLQSANYFPPPYLSFNNLCNLSCSNCTVGSFSGGGQSSCPSGESCSPPVLPPGTYTVTFTIPTSFQSYMSQASSFNNVQLNISWSAQNNGLQVYITGSYKLYAAYGNCPAFNKGIYSISMLPQIPASCLSQMYFDMSKLYQYNSSNNSWYVCVPVELNGLSLFADAACGGKYPPLGPCESGCIGPTTSIEFVSNPSTCQYSLFTLPQFLIARLYIDGNYVGSVNLQGPSQWGQNAKYGTGSEVSNYIQSISSSISGGCHTLCMQLYYYDQNGNLVQFKDPQGNTQWCTQIIKMYDGSIKPFDLGGGISGTHSWQWGCPETSVVDSAIKNSVTVKSTFPSSITLNGTGYANGYYCSNCNLIPEIATYTPYLGCGYVYPISLAGQNPLTGQPYGCYGSVPMTSSNYSSFVALDKNTGYYFLCASNLTMQMCSDSSSPGSMVVGGTTLQPGQCANLSTSNIYYGYFPYGVNIYVPEGNPGGTYKLVFQYVGDLPQVVDGFIVGALNNQVLWSQTVTITVSGPPPPSGCNVVVNVASSPGGIPVSASPTSTSISQGQSATIQFSAPSTYSIGGYGYKFQYWVINGQTYTQTNPSITVTCQQVGQTITINAMAYYQLVSTPTTSPTTSPTVSPTVSPTSPTYVPPPTSPTVSPTVTPTTPTVSPTVSPTSPTLVVPPTPPPPMVTTKELGMLGLVLAVGALIGLGAYVATSRRRKT